MQPITQLSRQSRPNALTPLDPHTTLIDEFTAGNRDIKNTPEAFSHLAGRRNAIAPGDLGFEAVAMVAKSTLTDLPVESGESTEALSPHKLLSIVEERLYDTESAASQSLSELIET